MPPPPGRIRPFGSAGGEAPGLAAVPADAFDRPLTVPVLVRGALDSRVLAALFWPGAAALALGSCILLQRAGDTRAGLALLAVAVVVLGLAGALLLYRLPRRLWLQVTATGFVVTRGGADEAYSDEQVAALSRDSSTAQDGGVTHYVVLEVARGGELARFPCKYYVPPGQDDPLASFWDRLAGRLAQRVREGLGRGAALAGPRWRLDEGGLRWRGGVIEITRLRKVGYFDGQLCVWRDDDERPFAALPRGGRNVQPLAVLLWELIQQGPHANAPLPGRPLGRVILDRRSREWRVLLLLLGLFTPAMALVAARQLFDPFGRKGESVALAAFFAGLLCLFAALAVWSWFTRLRFHEYGVAQPGLWGTKVLRYEQIETMTCRGTNLLVFAPAPGSGLPTVRFRRLGSDLDEGLKALRDHVAWLVGYRWAERQPHGPVRWTLRLRFLPGGLEYRPWQLFGVAPAVTVPYHYTHYVLIGEELHLHVQGSDRPVCKQSTREENFFPGLALLDLIYESCRPAPPEVDRAPAPRGRPAGPETRIVGTEGGPTGVKPGG